MGVKDITLKEYMSEPGRFADVFNYAAGHKMILNPDSLKTIDARELMTGTAGALERNRDLLQEGIIQTDGSTAYMILGIENQDSINYAMPVRTMTYDALDYERQLKEKRKKNAGKYESSEEFLSGFTKGDRLKPVVTVTIFWSGEEWSGPRKLSDLFEEIPGEIGKLVNDYRLNLIVPSEISDFGGFESDMKQLMEVVAASASKEKLKKLTLGEEYRHLPAETASVISKLTNIRIEINEGESEVDMCRGMQEWLEEERAAGEACGMAMAMLDSVRKFVASGMPFEKVADILEITDEQRKEIASELGILN